MDDKLLKLLEPLDENEQALMKLDSIFKALDVNTIQDIETLGTYFIASNNTDLNSEYKQYNEKINNKLHSSENGNNSSQTQNSLRPGSSRTRTRSHTVTHGVMNAKKISTIDDIIREDKSESEIDKMTLIKNKKYSLDTNDSLSSNANSSIHGSHTTNTSKNSSNTSINNQREDDYGLIDPSDTMVVIKRFLRDQKRNKLSDQLSSSTELLNDDDFEKKLENIDKNKKKKKNNKLSSKAYEQIQKDYWERMTNIIDDKRYRLWKVFKIIMNK